MDCPTTATSDSYKTAVQKSCIGLYVLALLLPALESAKAASSPPEPTTVAPAPLYRDPVFDSVIPLAARRSLLQAAIANKAADRTTVFDLEGKRILQDEDHLGIVNGKLTAGINYRDVAGLAGLWAPPFVSSNFIFDSRVDGAKVPTSKWLWRPFQVERVGSLGEVSVSTVTTMIYGHRAAVVSFTFKNSGHNSVPLEFFTLGWLDSVADWGFVRPGSRTETTLLAVGQRLTLRQGEMSMVLAIDSPEWSWDVAGNLGHAV